MVDLVVRRLKQTNPELISSGANTADAVRHAHVPTESKRDFLDLVMQEAGAETLLSIGQGIRDVAYDPLWHAAVRSADPAVLFDKWRRFEVFGHSRNRLRIDQNHERRASFRRYTVDGGTPTMPENLLICGLIIALLEEIGCRGLQCEMPLDDETTHVLRQDRRFSVPQDAGMLSTDTWTIEWRTFSPREEDTTPLSEFTEIAPPHSLGSSVKTALRLLTSDAARHWKVAELAREAGLSTRSLQRGLRDAELSFSGLVRLVRIHEACRLLKNSDAPITTIGFCAGFSDSAHFSRDFRASMGMTPTDYRTAS